VARTENIIVGLDIGTTKICALIGEVIAPDQVKIIGTGRVPSKGLRRGVVVNFEDTVASIRAAVEQAESQADLAVDRLYAGIAGEHIRSSNSRGVVVVSGEDNEITRADVDRVVRAARQIGLPADQQIIHAISQEYIIDDQGGIREPVGLSGVRLEAIVHIVTGSVTSVANIIKCVRRAGYEIADLVLEPIASSHAVLSPDEMELGVVLLDIGGGTTDFTLFFQGAVRHSGVVAVGGDFVTRDLAYGLRTSHQNAEVLKRSAGSCLVAEIDPEERVTVPRLGSAPEPPSAGGEGAVETAVAAERMVRRQVLAEIIAPRMEEIFVLVDQQLRRSEYYDLASGGMVLTGGASQLDGVVRLAEQLFQMPVRRGVPQGVSGLTEGLVDPSNATGIGLLQYGHEHRSRHFEETSKDAGFMAALRQWTRRILRKF
jgi:cell division protein FtsA